MGIEHIWIKTHHYTLKTILIAQKHHLLKAVIVGCNDFKCKVYSVQGLFRFRFSNADIHSSPLLDFEHFKA